MEPGVLIFLTLTGFLGLGLFWFRVIEPVIEEARVWIARYRREVMSSNPEVGAEEIAPSASTSHQNAADRSDRTPDGLSDRSQTEAQTASDGAQTTHAAPASVLVSLRRHGYTRAEARALLRTLGWTFDNNAWAAAAEETQSRTPIAGRPVDPKLFRPIVGRDDDEQENVQ